MRYHSCDHVMLYGFVDFKIIILGYMSRSNVITRIPQSRELLLAASSEAVRKIWSVRRAQYALAALEMEEPCKKEDGQSLRVESRF